MLKSLFVIPFLIVSFVFFWWFPPIFALCAGIAFYLLTEDWD